ncbi:hypothetical protein Leryth_023910 [Lithospermum erythrorhizon]|nr:hypothetical protein Leryth_023910 [Lithospermum erythrorhizon]
MKSCTTCIQNCTTGVKTNYSIHISGTFLTPPSSRSFPSRTTSSNLLGVSIFKPIFKLFLAELGERGLIVTGGSLEESREALAIAEIDAHLFCIVVMHPTRCKEFDGAGIQSIIFKRFCH